MQNAAARDRDQAGGEREVVEAQRAGDEVLVRAPLPDQQPGRGGQGAEPEDRDDDHLPLAAAAEQADEQGQRRARRSAR